MLRPRIKVCCIATLDEARLAVRCGAAALGLVSAMPSGPGVIDEELIAAIARCVPPPIATFLLTSLQTAAAIVAQHERCRTNVLQLVDELPQAELRALRRALPGVKLVQVIHVIGSPSLEQARAVEPLVDALLLDSGNPAAPVKELGGTGRTHDWSLSRRVRDSVAVPVFLAGGLRPENAAAALAAVQPFGLDVCSGVRTSGALDAAKLRAFCGAANVAP
jgi:phosphoribosylanthranilate isomerase